MTKQYNPTPLERFVPEDFKVLQYVADHGQITIDFDTDSQACSTRAHLRRLVSSLQALKPDDPLTKAAQTFIFKWRVRTTLLTISQRTTSREIKAMNRAMQGKVEAISSDPMESPEYDIEALERAYQERKDGEAGKGSSGNGAP